ncbi:MAG: hypothetical protein II304_02705 [Bacteroidales bacterium]|nr:hypothetical protein [Bacteroidales bacterium]
MDKYLNKAIEILVQTQDKDILAENCFYAKRHGICNCDECNKESFDDCEYYIGLQIHSLVNSEDKLWIA